MLNLIEPLVVTLAFLAGQITEGPQASRGIIALYDFEADDGDVIRDRTGFGHNLRIENPKAVTRSSGQLQVRRNTRIQAASSKNLIAKD